MITLRWLARSPFWRKAWSLPRGQVHNVGNLGFAPEQFCCLSSQQLVESTWPWSSLRLPQCVSSLIFAGLPRGSTGSWVCGASNSCQGPSPKPHFATELDGILGEPVCQAHPCLGHRARSSGQAAQSVSWRRVLRLKAMVQWPLSPTYTGPGC